MEAVTMGDLDRPSTHADLIAAALGRHPSRTAFVSDGRHYSSARRPS
jgi:hypothetical protein